PYQIAELHDEVRDMNTVKESSADVRRIAAVRLLLGDELNILVGVDDLIVEALEMGAVGWIAGLVNALAVESVRLVELAKAGKKGETFDRCRWFLPLLRLDIGTKFFQMSKLAQERTGHGNARVRPPRHELEGSELAATLAVIEEGL